MASCGMPPLQKPAGPAPTPTRLHEAALRHLSRFAATEAGLTRVLDGRVRRWAARAVAEGQETDETAGTAVGAARAAVRAVVAALVQAGAVDDRAFATARAVRLVRAGRSRRATSAHLTGKGVSAEVAAEALPEGDELGSALAYAKRRRIGPFRQQLDPEMRLRDLGALARAGFPRDVAERALAMGAEDAMAAVLAFKRG